MLDDYGVDSGDKYPAKYGGKPQHERSNLMLTNPVRTNRLVYTLYSKTCLKQPLKKKTENWFSRPNFT